MLERDGVKGESDCVPASEGPGEGLSFLDRLSQSGLAGQVDVGAWIMVGGLLKLSQGFLPASGVSTPEERRLDGAVALKSADGLGFEAAMP